MARPRRSGRRDLPENLLPRHRVVDGVDVIYWYWRDPRDGREKSLQCRDDRTLAIKRARELNAHVYEIMADQIVHAVTRAPDRHSADVPFDSHAARCLSLAAERGLAENSLKSRRSLTSAASTFFGSRPLQQIGVPDVATLLRNYTDQGKNRTAQAMRSLLVDLWNEAKRDGILAVDHPNVPAITRRPTAKVARARLTLDEFNLVLREAELMAPNRGRWIANRLLLALVTGQRREDVATMQFCRGADWNVGWQGFQQGDRSVHPYPFVEDGYLWVVQQKTAAMVRIPLSLRLNALQLSVGDVVDRCRDNVASRYLVHHDVATGNAPLGTAVWKDTITRGFFDARERTPLQWPGKTPPTFHEIRSLSERLYKAEGIDTQALLGHRHARMTAVYDDPRQAEWTTVR